MKSLRESKR